MASFGSQGMLIEDGCNPDSLQPSSGSEDVQNAERVRVQELLRYLQPYESSPPQSEKARLATDTTLTAFAQLCALRLDCDRAFISLMDDSHQYLIAEATRTISLRSADTFDTESDALFLGQTILDFTWGVCPGTLACFTSRDESLNLTTEYIKATRNHYVMNDMSQLEGFKDRPYIAGWPHMRYYAEVPIHSPSGLTIGTLCVVDTKPREGLDTKGLAILEEISHAVMNHLELCVSKIQRNNAERMIHALGQFVQGKDSVRSWWTDAQSSRIAEPGHQHLSIAERADIEFGSSPRATFVKEADQETASQLQKLTVASREPLKVEESHGSLCSENSATSDIKCDQTSETTTTTLATTATDSNNFSDSYVTRGTALEKAPMPTSALSDLEALLDRATNLIREGVGFDGVVFLDPRAHDGTLLVNRNSMGDGAGSGERVRRSSQLSTQHFLPSRSSSKEQTKSCNILASSVQKESDQTTLPTLSEQSLEYLLTHFLHGGVLHYDDKGLIGESNKVFNWDDPNPDVYAAHHTISVPKDKGAANKLRESFPGATSIMLFPLWDATRDKWFAYSVAWTSNPNRTFRREDFAYLATFSNSIMAEISRLDIVAADQAKAGFISSISHELRSPLHGIMASVEMLYDMTPDPSSFDTIRTIQACGSTLLETMDNLLTFAKIRRLTAVKDTPLGEVRGKSIKKSRMVDLATLVEDTVQVCIAGQSFRKSVETSSYPANESSVDNKVSDIHTPALTVICDVGQDADWVFNTDVGLWKRVLMNLLGNALKYTSTGMIHVKLRMGVTEDEKKSESIQKQNQLQQDQAAGRNFNLLRMDSNGNTFHTHDWQYIRPKPSPSPKHEHGKSSSQVVLSVEDTGRGISSEFMSHHLFKPFFQENSLSPGTGLGLSIVSQLMSSIGGVIDVASEPGTGTKVTVSCQLESPLVKQNTQPKLSELPEFSNIKVGVFGLNGAPDLRQIPNGILDSHAKGVLAIRSSLTNCASRLGLNLVEVDSLKAGKIDVVIITEEDFDVAQKEGTITGDQRFVVLSSKSVLRPTESYSIFKPAIILQQPFGPRRFKQVLELAVAHSDTKESPAVAAMCSPVPVSRASIIESKPTQAQEVPTGGPRILLVEDNAINLKILTLSMTKIGHAFATASDGAQALQTYIEAEGAFDVIVMDIQMPVMDGLEASRAIRQWENERGQKPTFIIALTALTSKESEEKALDAGADRFISKPMSMRRLKELLSEVLGDS